jgi:hypothetical protein
MWTFRQSDGFLLDPSGKVAGQGYSGHGAGIDDPQDQNVPDVGPIPAGNWTIGAPIDSPSHGPFAMPLTPLPGTNTFGRTYFFIHGDEVANPGLKLASLGCIVLPRLQRQAVWNSGDRQLVVISGLAVEPTPPAQQQNVVSQPIQQQTEQS